MNQAEHRRDVRISAMEDRALINLIVRDTSGDVTTDEQVAFSSIRKQIASTPFDCDHRIYLSRKQRAWAEEIVQRITPIRADEAPRGKEGNA